MLSGAASAIPAYDPAPATCCECPRATPPLSDTSATQPPPAPPPIHPSRPSHRSAPHARPHAQEQPGSGSRPGSAVPKHIARRKGARPGRSLTAHTTPSAPHTLPAKPGRTPRTAPTQERQQAYEEHGGWLVGWVAEGKGSDRLLRHLPLLERPPRRACPCQTIPTPHQWQTMPTPPRRQTMPTPHLTHHQTPSANHQ